VEGASCKSRTAGTRVFDGYVKCAGNKGWEVGIHLDIVEFNSVYNGEKQRTIETNEP